jgi:hypothetical protein
VLSKGQKQKKIRNLVRKLGSSLFSLLRVAFP